MGIILHDDQRGSGKLSWQFLFTTKKKFKVFPIPSENAASLCPNYGQVVWENLGRDAVNVPIHAKW